MSTLAETATAPPPRGLALRAMAEIRPDYPHWRVRPDMLGWDACGTGPFRQLAEPGGPLRSIHAGSRAALRTLLAVAPPHLAAARRGHLLPGQCAEAEDIPARRSQHPNAGPRDCGWRLIRGRSHGR